MLNQSRWREQQLHTSKSDKQTIGESEIRSMPPLRVKRAFCAI